MAAKKPVKSLGKKDMKRVKGGEVKAVKPPTQEKYLEVKLENVQITSYQL
jgi:type VI protein secretion system component Hcp